MLRVQGLASSSLYESTDPLSPMNRRISIIVMNREAEDRFYRGAAEPTEPARSNEAIAPSIEPIPRAILRH